MRIELRRRCIACYQGTMMTWDGVDDDDESAVTCYVVYFHQLPQTMRMLYVCK